MFTWFVGQKDINVNLRQVIGYFSDQVFCRLAKLIIFQPKNKWDNKK